MFAQCRPRQLGGKTRFCVHGPIAGVRYPEHSLHLPGKAIHPPLWAIPPKSLRPGRRVKSCSAAKSAELPMFAPELHTGISNAHQAGLG